MSNESRQIPPLADHEERTPYLCPCGASDWRACYDLPANQGVDLYVGADGTPEEGEYHGDEDIDGDPGPNVMYICQACSRLVNPDGTPVERPEPQGSSEDLGDEEPA
jgi:hypothetical protein